MKDFSQNSGWVKGYIQITEAYNEALTRNLMEDSEGISSITGKRALSCGSFSAVKSNGMHCTHVNSLTASVPKGLDIQGIASASRYTGLSKWDILRDRKKGLPVFETFRRLYFCSNSLHAFYGMRNPAVATVFRENWNKEHPETPIEIPL